MVLNSALLSRSVDSSWIIAPPEFKKFSEFPFGAGGAPPTAELHQELSKNISWSVHTKEANHLEFES